MLTRLAFFEGKIRSGHETDFDRYVRETLLPAGRVVSSPSSARR